MQDTVAFIEEINCIFEEWWYPIIFYFCLAVAFKIAIFWQTPVSIRVSGLLICAFKSIIFKKVSL